MKKYKKRESSFYGKKGEKAQDKDIHLNIVGMGKDGVDWKKASPPPENFQMFRISIDTGKRKNEQHVIVKPSPSPDPSISGTPEKRSRRTSTRPSLGRRQSQSPGAKSRRDSKKPLSYKGGKPEDDTCYTDDIHARIVERPPEMMRPSFDLVNEDGSLSRYADVGVPGEVEPDLRKSQNKPNRSTPPKNVNYGDHGGTTAESTTESDNDDNIGFKKRDGESPDSPFNKEPIKINALADWQNNLDDEITKNQATNKPIQSLSHSSTSEPPKHPETLVPHASNLKRDNNFDDHASPMKSNGSDMGPSKYTESGSPRKPLSHTSRDYPDGPYKTMQPDNDHSIEKPESPIMETEIGPSKYAGNESSKPHNLNSQPSDMTRQTHPDKTDSFREPVTNTKIPYSQPMGAGSLRQVVEPTSQITRTQPPDLSRSTSGTFHSATSGTTKKPEIYSEVPPLQSGGASPYRQPINPALPKSKDQNKTRTQPPDLSRSTSGTFHSATSGTTKKPEVYSEVPPLESGRASPYRQPINPALLKSKEPFPEFSAGVNPLESDEEPETQTKIPPLQSKATRPVPYTSVSPTSPVRSQYSTYSPRNHSVKSDNMKEPKISSENQPLQTNESAPPYKSPVNPPVGKQSGYPSIKPSKTGGSELAKLSHTSSGYTSDLSRDLTPERVPYKKEPTKKPSNSQPSPQEETYSNLNIPPNFSTPPSSKQPTADKTTKKSNNSQTGSSVIEDGRKPSRDSYPKQRPGTDGLYGLGKPRRSSLVSTIPKPLPKSSYLAAEHYKPTYGKPPSREKEPQQNTENKFPDTEEDKNTKPKFDSPSSNESVDSKEGGPLIPVDEVFEALQYTPEEAGRNIRFPKVAASEENNYKPEAEDTSILSPPGSQSNVASIEISHTSFEERTPNGKSIPEYQKENSVEQKSLKHPGNVTESSHGIASPRGERNRVKSIPMVETIQEEEAPTFEGAPSQDKFQTPNQNDADLAVSVGKGNQLAPLHFTDKPKEYGDNEKGSNKHHPRKIENSDGNGNGPPNSNQTSKPMASQKPPRTSKTSPKPKRRSESGQSLQPAQPVQREPSTKEKHPKVNDIDGSENGMKPTTLDELLKVRQTPDTSYNVYFAEENKGKSDKKEDLGLTPDDKYKITIVPSDGPKGILIFVNKKTELNRNPFDGQHMFLDEIGNTPRDEYHTDQKKERKKHHKPRDYEESPERRYHGDPRSRDKADSSTSEGDVKRGGKHHYSSGRPRDDRKSPSRKRYGNEKPRDDRESPSKNQYYDRKPRDNRESPSRKYYYDRKPRDDEESPSRKYYHDKRPRSDSASKSARTRDKRRPSHHGSGYDHGKRSRSYYDDERPRKRSRTESGKYYDDQRPRSDNALERAKTRDKRRPSHHRSGYDKESRPRRYNDDERSRRGSVKRSRTGTRDSRGYPRYNDKTRTLDRRSKSSGPYDDRPSSGRKTESISTKKSKPSGVVVERSPSGGKITQNYPCGCIRFIYLDGEELSREEIFTAYCEEGSQCEVQFPELQTTTRTIKVESDSYTEPSTPKYPSTSVKTYTGQYGSSKGTHYPSSLVKATLTERLFPDIEIIADGVVSKKPIPHEPPAPTMRNANYAGTINIKSNKLNGVCNLYFDPRLVDFVCNNIDDIRLFVKGSEGIRITESSKPSYRSGTQSFSQIYDRESPPYYASGASDRRSKPSGRSSPQRSQDVRESSPHYDRGVSDRRSKPSGRSSLRRSQDVRESRPNYDSGASDRRSKPSGRSSLRRSQGNQESTPYYDDNSSFELKKGSASDLPSDVYVERTSSGRKPESSVSQSKSRPSADRRSSVRNPESRTSESKSNRRSSVRNPESRTSESKSRPSGASADRRSSVKYPENRTSESKSRPSGASTDRRSSVRNPEGRTSESNSRPSRDSDNRRSSVRNPEGRTSESNSRPSRSSDDRRSSVRNPEGRTSESNSRPSHDSDNRRSSVRNPEGRTSESNSRPSRDSDNRRSSVRNPEGRISESNSRPSGGSSYRPSSDSKRESIISERK